MKTLLVTLISLSTFSSFACDQETLRDVTLVSCKTTQTQETLKFQINVDRISDLFFKDQVVDGCMSVSIVEAKEGLNNANYKFNIENGVLELSYAYQNRLNNIRLNVKHLRGIKNDVETVVCDSISGI